MVIIEVPIRRVTHRVNGAEEHLYSLDTGLWDMQEIVTDNEPQIIAQITNPLKEWALNNVGGSGDSAVLFRFVPVPSASHGDATGKRDVSDDTYF